MPRPYLTSVVYPIEESWFEQPQIARVFAGEHFGDGWFAVVVGSSPVGGIRGAAFSLDENPKLAVFSFEFHWHV